MGYVCEKHEAFVPDGEACRWCEPTAEQLVWCKKQEHFPVPPPPIRWPAEIATRYAALDIRVKREVVPPDVESAHSALADARHRAERDAALREIGEAMFELYTAAGPMRIAVNVLAPLGQRINDLCAALDKP